MESKICTTCKYILPATSEYFTPNKKYKNGITSRCRKCTAEYLKMYSKINEDRLKQYRNDYYLENKTDALEKSKKYQEINKENIKKRKHAYYVAHKEKHSLKQKEYRLSNKAYMAEYSRQYRIKNSEKLKEYHKIYENSKREILTEKHRDYRLINKEKFQTYERERSKKIERIEMNKRYRKSEQGKTTHNSNNQKRRALRRNLEVAFTQKQWTECVTHFNNECAYCGNAGKLTQEHFIPLVKGGEYTINNIIPACGKCNSSKQEIDFFEWYPKQPFYNRKRENRILRYLNYVPKTKLQQLALC